MNLATDQTPGAQAEAIAQANAYTSNSGLPSYTDLVDTIADLSGVITMLWARLPEAPTVTLNLQADEAAELREWLDAELMDLSTINVEDEDRPRLERMHRVLAKLNGGA